MEDHGSSVAKADSGDARSSGERSGHTPGPWEVEPAVGRGAWIKGESGEWAAVACGDTDLSARANALLIGAAPELLEALLDVSAMLMGRPDVVAKLHPLMGFAEKAVFERARAAIAKATGKRS